jgi:uncharacterized protein (DUF433 family)
MTELRETATFFREKLDDEYALVSERLKTDGVRLFVELDEEHVITPRSGQLNFPEIIKAIEKDIGRGASGELRTLRLNQYPDSAQVVIDPRFGWGSPVLAEQKVPVKAIVSLWQAGEPMDAVAREYALTRDVVENVCRAAA